MAPFQIVFTADSSKEMSALPKPVQLEILRDFHLFTPGFMESNEKKFGAIKRGDRTIYRYRSGEYRIYFEPSDKGLLIQRIFTKNSLQDFLFRSQLSQVKEDEHLEKNPRFWEMIDSTGSKEGEK